MEYGTKATVIHPGVHCSCMETICKTSSIQINDIIFTFFVNYAFKRFDRTIDIRINLFIVTNNNKTTHLLFALIKISMVQVNNRPIKNDIRIRQLIRIFIIILPIWAFLSLG